MTRKLLVRQGGGAATEVDFLDLPAARKGAPWFEGDTPLIQMGQRFANGESAMGYFKVVDPEAALSTTGFRMRPWCEVRLTEDASGDELTLGWMRVSAGDAMRRATYVGGDDIEHGPQLMDCNLDLRGIPFIDDDGWDRPAETDQQRLQAVRAAKLDGSGSTGTVYRDTTDITVSSIASGHLCDFSSDTDLEAKNYPAGTEVVDVISDVAGQAGKVFGVVLHHDAGSTHKCLLYVDQDDFTTYATDIRISDDLADYNPTGTDATFEPHWLQGAGRESNNEQVASGILSIYSGTNDEPATVLVETGEDPDEWETWVGVYNDDEATSLTSATRRANWVLEDRKRPFVSHRASILVAAEQAHLVEAGMAIETKSVVMNSGPDKASWVWRRVVEKKIEPVPDGRYWLHLSLERPRFTPRGNGSGQPASTTPKPAPDCIEQEPDSETILADSRDGDWGTTVTTGTCWGGDDHRDISGSGQLGPVGSQAVSAGDLIRATVNVRDETGNDSWENVDNYNYHAALQFTGTGMPLLSYTIINERFHNAGCIDETRTTTQEVPTGYTSARIKMYSKLGRWRFNAWLSEVVIGDPIENDPDCLPAGTGGDSTHWARSDDTRFDADDQHLTTKLQQRVINNSGGPLSDGQIVIPDITQDDPSVTTTTDAAQTDAKVGVVTTAGADGEAIVVMWEGAMLRSLTIDGTPVAGDYLYTSTTAGAADAAGTRDTGAVGRVIAVDDDDNTTWVLWWGVPDTAGGSVASTEFVFNTDGGKEIVNTVAAAGSTETLDLADGNVHDVTLTADCTLTLTGATNGVACTMGLLLRQGSGAPWDVTWPGSVEWVGGSAPTLETVEDAWNLVTLMTLDGGTTWFADGGAGTGMGTIDYGEDADISDLNFSDTADAGVLDETARADHVHGMPSDPSVGLGNPIGEGRPFLTGQPTLYVAPGITFTGVSAGTTATGTRFYTAIIVREQITLVALMAECTLGAAAGREFRGGLYEADWTWQPGALVLEGVFNLATSGVKTIAAAGGGQVLAPGRYLTVYESNNGTPTMRVWQGNAMFASTGSANVLNSQFSVTGTTYGALPDPGTAWTGAILSNTGPQMRVLLQVDP